MTHPTDGSAEDRLIATYFRPLATHPGAFNLEDDAAAIAPPPGCDLVLTTDGVISGVHVFPDDPADTVARKVLRMNLSDLAAKGAAPLGFLLALGLPAGLPGDWIAQFAKGLGADAEAYGCPLLGGDTDRSPGPMTAHVTALGAVPHGGMVRRSGARAGDVLVVTGTVGDAALGLRLRLETALADRWGLAAAQRDHLLDRYLLPQPRIVLADLLRRYARAAMDVSDGLAGDVAKLCRVSGVGAVVAADALPLSPAARQVVTADPTAIATILTGGDDFEIIAAVRPEDVKDFVRDSAALGVAVQAIGSIEPGSSVRFLSAGGQVMTFERPGYSHF